jgi:hypothetical protein
MSLSHHSWRSSSGATADDRRFGAKTDRTRRVSHRINDHAPVAVHRPLSTRSRSMPRLFELPGAAATSISRVWMQIGCSAERDRGRSGAGLVSWARRSRLGRTASAARAGLARVDPPHVVPAPVGVAGLAELPNSVVALRAVPDWEARLFRRTSSCRVPRDRLWSRSHPCSHTSPRSAGL